MIIPAAERLRAVEEYYFSAKLQEIREMVARGIPVINLGVGSPDLPPSSSTIQQLAESARKPDHHGYQAHKGIPALREAIAGYLQSTHHLTVDPATELLTLPGSKQGMIYLALAFLNPGEKALVAELSYPTYTSVTRLAGGEVVTYALNPDDGWAPDWDALDRMDLAGVRLLWANYPHMPTGAPARRSKLQRLVNFALRRGILVCHDNPYSMLSSTTEPMSILSCDGGKEAAVELGSMSKSHNMAGWRLGWIAGRKDYVNTVLRVASNVESGIFLPLQEAAVHALKTGPEWYRQVQTEYDQRRTIGTSILNELGCTVEPGQAGMFVWARIPEQAPEALRFSDEILRTRHVFLTPGSLFGLRGNRYLRLSLCSPGDVLHTALDRVRSHAHSSTTTTEAV
jgi:aspartate/methionine/tyrosine aminotransferase